MKRYSTILLLFFVFTFGLTGISLASPLHDAQVTLSQLGYKPGPADGKMGHQTSQALKNFQRDHHIPVTGQADQKTMDMLQKRNQKPAQSGQIGHKQP